MFKVRLNECKPTYTAVPDDEETSVRASAGTVPCLPRQRAQSVRTAEVAEADPGVRVLDGFYLYKVTVCHTFMVDHISTKLQLYLDLNIAALQPTRLCLNVILASAHPPGQCFDVFYRLRWCSGKLSRQQMVRSDMTFAGTLCLSRVYIPEVFLHSF